MAFDIRLEHIAARFSEGVEPEAPTRDERRRKRAQVLREPLEQRVARIVGALARNLHPGALRTTAASLDLIIRDRSISALDLPDPEQALSTPDGLCGVTADLSPAAIVDGYSRGLHLHGCLGRPTWWSPSTRLVIEPGAMRLSGKVRRHLHRRDLRVSFDRTPEEVIAACARPNVAYGQPGFGPPLTRAYMDLHDAGMGHSVEVRDRAGGLVAGLYGLSIGRVFVLEQTFGPADAVDLAMVVLHRHLDLWAYDMSDVKRDERFARLGFAAVPRKAFRARLVRSLNGGQPGRWQVDQACCDLEFQPRRAAPAAA